MGNCTIFMEFLLMDISSSWGLQVLQDLMFLVIYLGALTGKLLTITIIVTDPRLHFPMYFFVGNLSLLDFCYISVTVPNSIVNSLAGKKCAAQAFLFIFFRSTEFFVLVTMSYDINIAICHCLHYGVTMTLHFCIQLAQTYVRGLVYSAIHTGTIFRLPFTKSNVIHQYFCDIPQVIEISTQAVQFSESVVLAVSFCFVLISFVILFTSYVNIFLTVLQLCSVEDQNKALSTCSHQIVTIILFIISVLFASLGPISNESTILTLLTSMFYSMVPPFINPIIFSLRNSEIKRALGGMFTRSFQFLYRADFLNGK